MVQGSSAYSPRRSLDLDDARAHTLPAAPDTFVGAAPAASAADALAGDPAPRATPETSSGDPVRPVRPVRLHAVPHARAKRATDIVVALIGLLIAAPFMALIAVLIKLTSRGPIIFKQVRVREGGRHFTCYKFRSMCTDAEERRKELLHLNEASGPVFKIRQDPRVTPVGRILRKLSLDELPQLWNVLRGDMSVVGPRPPVPYEVEHYTERQLGRLAVRPGLTCLWQISGRSNVAFDHWVELDLLYIETMSFWGDLQIIARTIPAVLLARGAH